MLEARPLARNTRLLIVDVVVGFAVSIELYPRFARVTGLLAEVQGVVIARITVDANNSAFGQIVQTVRIDVDALEERLVVYGSEVSDVEECGDNPSLGHLASGFGLDLDSAHDAHLSVFGKVGGENSSQCDYRSIIRCSRYMKEIEINKPSQRTGFPCAEGAGVRSDCDHHDAS